ncbi:hypothetical protein TcBrA4_0131580 [Trypanosoma cruzi]|nr:hypothetical protein TcBrA4_0131580 [Trypanosoma cruzi]
MLPQRILTGVRWRFSTQASQGNLGRPHLSHLTNMPSRTSLDAHSGTEDQVLHFVAFGVATWALRIWNEGISVVIADLLSAYSYYWHQADAQAQLAFGSPLSWTRALDMDRDFADRFKDFGRALLQAFRMQTMIASS